VFVVAPIGCTVYLAYDAIHNHSTFSFWLMVASMYITGMWLLYPPEECK
jgi:hypothetical protein